MSFVIVGLNHATAPLEVLEQVTIPAEEVPKALHDLAHRPYLSESVVLSTCNRTELYIEAERFHGAFQDVRDFFAQWSGIRPDRLADVLYTYYDDQAVEHLFRVSAGMDSAVVGEHEILGQVKRAWQASIDAGCAGPRLNSVFRAALGAGKRVRTETGIGRNVASVSQAAIVLAADQLGSLADKEILLIGAGEMGSGMAMSLGERQPASITVMSRRLETSADLATRIGACTRPFSDLFDALVECDVAFTSTAAPSLVIAADDLDRVMAARAGRPLVLVDVAMPRDIDPAAAGIDHVALFDLEAIGAHVAMGLNNRLDELDAARTIVAQAVARYGDQMGQAAVTPLIAEFRAQAEQIRADELARRSSRLGDLSAGQRAAVDEVTKAVLAKLLHEPTVRLKEASTSLRGERLAQALRELYDL